MSYYLIPIRYAMMIFPILAAFITLPYMISQYHRYGSILSMRVLIIYSFIFYLLCAYFLTMLPLPPIEDVAKMSGATMQLISFNSLQNLIQNTSFIWNDPSTYLLSLNESALYEPLFNVFLLLPLGIYLRYYFTLSLKKTFIICFLVSLSFECIQLSGLFGIYPRPYRLFDVDDLINNNLGGLLGYALTPLFSRFLIKKSDLDEKAYVRGLNVSPLRHFLAFFIDAFIIFSINFLFFLLTKGVIHYEYYFYYYIFTIIFYFIMIPIWTKGRTLGKFLVNIKLVQTNGKEARWYQFILRYTFLYIIVLPTPFVFYQLLNYALISSNNVKITYIIIAIILSFLFLLSIFQVIATLFTSNLQPIYAYISQLEIISTVKYIQDDITKEENKTEILS